jgi:hypothetical protein
LTETAEVIKESFSSDIVKEVGTGSVDKDSFCCGDILDEFD